METKTYTIVKELGKGGFASVLLAKDSVGQVYAIKKIDKERNQAHNIAREIQAGKLLSHPNIIQYKASAIDDSNNNYLIFEYIQGLDMLSYFGGVRKFEKFSEREASHVAFQMVAALNYSHKAGVVHLDIKLDNIMIDPTNHFVKLIDFGLCDFITTLENGSHHDDLNRRVGSEEYCAPELFSAATKSFSGVKLDVWCLGVVLYCLLSSQFPFDNDQRKLIMFLGKQHPLPTFSFPISESGKDLLTKMLTTDALTRITMEEIAIHPWIKQAQQLQTSL